jgi:hypothetical protein
VGHQVLVEVQDQAVHLEIVVHQELQELMDLQEVQGHRVLQVQVV